MAHGFQSIGKHAEQKDNKALRDWAWDKLKKAAKYGGKKAKALILNRDKSIFPAEVSFIDVDSEEVQEATQIAGQSSMFGLPSKKGGGIVSNPMSGNPLSTPKSDNVSAASSIVHMTSQNGNFFAKSIESYDANDPSQLLQSIASNTQELVRVVQEHEASMVHQSLRKERHDDIMAARSRAWLEQKAFGGGTVPSGGGGSGLSDIAGLGLDLAMGGKGGGKSSEMVKLLGGSVLGGQAAKSMSGLGKTGKAGSIMKYGAGRAVKRAAIKAGGAGAAKVLGKSIPGVGLALGALFGLGKFAKGDWVGGLAEIGSGLLSSTGAGIPLQVALDSAIVAKDMADNAGSADSGGIIDKQIHTGGLDGKGGSLTMTHPGELIANTNQLKEIPNYFLDTLSEREPDFSKAIGLGLYWNQKKYPIFWEGKGGGGDGKEKLPPIIIQGLSQIGRGLIGSKVGDGMIGPSFLRIFNENTELGKQLRAEDEVDHGSGIGATFRAMTGSKIGDGFIGPKWLGWKNKNQPTVDPQQVLRYLQSQGVDLQEATMWTNKIGEKSNFVGDKEGGLFGWDGGDFSKMKSAVGANWKDDWQGQLNYLIKDQVILKGSENNQVAGPNNVSVSSPNNTTKGNETANNLNDLSSDTSRSAMNPNVIVNLPMPGEGGGAVGTTPSGYLNGISMADTGTDVFANLKIRSLR